jgi:septal ring factor EnvC (AmiA/AmiB activator)
MKYILSFLIILCTCHSIYGQTNAKVKEMESERLRIEQQIAESSKLLSSTQKDVDGQLAQLSALSEQIKKQKQYVGRLAADVKAVDREIRSIGDQLVTLQAELERRRNHYAHALQLMSRKNTFENRLMFLLSAESFSQMVRRMRYLREYSNFQQAQGELLMAQQKELDAKRAELESTRQAKRNLLVKQIEQQQLLDKQQAEQQKLLSGLKKKQKEIRNRIAQQQRERDKLNEQINRIIEEELAAQKKKDSADDTKKSDSTMPAYKENAADKKLTGSFQSNKGKFPVPITGPYLVTSHYGINYVAGLNNVKINNHGVDVRGLENCYARAIFEGTVSAIFEHPQIQGSYIVMIRHGQYISAYFNLAALRVKKGDKVKTGEQLGLVRPDLSGLYTMQFQLRKDTERLNPEQWIAF